MKPFLTVEEIRKMTQPLPKNYTGWYKPKEGIILEMSKGKVVKVNDFRIEIITKKKK